MKTKKLNGNSNTGEKKNNLIKITAGILIIFCLIIGGVSASLTLITNESDFLSITNADMKVDFPTLVDGSGPYIENNISISQVDDFSYLVEDRTALLHGNEFLVSGPESINIALPAQESIFGMRIMDSITDPSSPTVCPKTDSSFTFTFKNGGSGGTVVGSVNVDPPVGEAFFIGVISSEPFDYIEVREDGAQPGENTGLYCENDYFGDIFLGGLNLPDLSPQITSTPTANQNHLTHIPITITNPGDTTAPELSAVKVNIKVTFNNNIIKEETRTVNMLNKNSETLYDFTFTPANAGTYNISVFADSDNNVLESNENNNKINESIIVHAAGCSAGCDDGDDKTGDYCVNGRCVNFGFLSGKLIKPIPDVNEATLDTTVHFYYSVDGVSGYCENAGGTIGKEYDNSEKAYKKIPDIPGARCSGLEVYMNVKNPSNNVEVVKSVLGVNGISDVAVKFDEFGGVGTYEVWVKNMTITDGSGNKVNYEFSGMEHYEFDVVEDAFNLEAGIATKASVEGKLGKAAGAELGLIKVEAGIGGYARAEAAIPRAYTVDYRGDKDFPESVEKP